MELVRTLYRILIIVIHIQLGHASGCEKDLTCDFSRDMCGFYVPFGLRTDHWFRTSFVNGIPNYQGAYAALKPNSSTLFAANFDLLTSPEFCSAAYLSVTFSYYIGQPDAVLHVHTQPAVSPEPKTFGHYYLWQETTVYFPTRLAESTEVTFRVSFPPNSLMPVGLDNIAIQPVRATPRPKPSTLSSRRPYRHSPGQVRHTTRHQAPPQHTATASAASVCTADVSCDFERDTCDFAADVGSGGHQWYRTSHINGIPDYHDSYMSLKPSTSRSSSAENWGQLSSPAFCQTRYLAVSFSYNIAQPGAVLLVFTQPAALSAPTTLVHKDYFSYIWLQKTLSFSTILTANTKVIFKVTFPPGSTLSVGLDDITITADQSGPLPSIQPTTPEVVIRDEGRSVCTEEISCDFENDLCGFNARATSAGLQWQRKSAVAGNGMSPFYYMSLEQRDDSSSHSQDLVSFPVCSSPYLSISFSYNIAREGTVLEVLTQADGDRLEQPEAFLYYSYFQNTWLKASLVLPGSRQTVTRVIFRGNLPSTGGHSIGVDDITVRPVSAAAASGITPRAAVERRFTTDPTSKAPGSVSGGLSAGDIAAIVFSILIGWAAVFGVVFL